MTSTALSGLPGPARLSAITAYLRANFDQSDKWERELMDDLVDIFDNEFQTHLQLKMECFGQVSSDIWTAAFASYTTSILKEVRRWAHELLNRDGVSPSRATVLNDLPARLAGLLSQEWMSGYPFVPSLPDHASTTYDCTLDGSRSFLLGQD
ncbi:hypothetical protein C8R43DRAFT_674631 [Mycena crocata]|nr:hypothetical protein C8R43DRAFT_674631 [Mycena crocata]